MTDPTPKSINPLFGLQYIAYCRTGNLVNKEDEDNEQMVNFARWQICKARNVLWNDPVWEAYTPQEILIEYFSIRFDEDDKLRMDFEAGLIEAKKSDVDWMLAAEAKVLAEQNDKIKGETGEAPKIEEFEDKY